MRAALLLAGALGLAACSPCNDGTIRVTITLPAFAIAADELKLSVQVSGASSQSGMLDVKHPPGQKTGSFDARIAKYQAGDEATISVEAYSQGTLLLQASKSTTLPSGCGTLAMDLAVTDVDIRVEQNIKNKVDILFMVDDSPGTGPKQAELRARFPQLIKILDDFGKTNPASYHIGVVTSDLGAGQFTLGGGQCKPGGRGGKLQPKGAAADPTCVPPTSGLNYIDYNQINQTNNLPAGQDLATTFGCMASVGTMGCGFEQPLESVYKALHDQVPENAGFLRNDAVLVVVWMTDEDDCSADPNTDLFDPSQTQYGALLSYRCTQYGIQCGNPPMSLPYGDSGGVQSPCSSLPPENGGKLIDVQKYVNYFTKPAAQGGVKVNPQDVVLAGITAPSSMGAESLLANPNPQPPGPYVVCPGPVDGKTCAVVLQHSCISPQNTQFFGDPAVRINQVIGAAANQQLTSVCDTSYQPALQGLGQKIVSTVGAGCITRPLLDPQSPDCTVEDETSNQDGSVTITAIPACAQSGGETPCWKLDSKPVCGGATTVGCCNPVCASDGDPGQHFGLSIDRGPGGQPPPNTTARVRCTAAVLPENTPSPSCGPPI
jgi:hypothetical protein